MSGGPGLPFTLRHADPFPQKTGGPSGYSVLIITILCTSIATNAAFCRESFEPSDKATSA